MAMATEAVPHMMHVVAGGQRFPVWMLPFSSDSLEYTAFSAWRPRIYDALEYTRVATRLPPTRRALNTLGSLPVRTVTENAVQ